MENYNIYLSTEREKYDFIDAARKAGAIVTGVSGCGDGYYIQIDATPDQAAFIDRIFYTAEIDALPAAAAWAAWKAQKLSVFQLSTWQQRHNIYFNENGNIMEV